MNSLSDPPTAPPTDETDTGVIKNAQTEFRHSHLFRIIKAVPLVIFAVLCNYTMGTILQSTFPLLRQAGSSLELELDNNVVVDVRSSFYGISCVDKLIRIYVCASLPSMVGLDRAHRLQMMSFLFDMGPMIIVWIVEGRRRAKSHKMGSWGFTISAWPFLSMMGAQVNGIGMIAPMYYFIHYVSSPLPADAPSMTGSSPIDIHEAKVLLPAVLISYYLPLLAQNLPVLSLPVRQIICGHWQLYPVWLSITYHGLRLWYSSERTKNTERLRSEGSISGADMACIRRAYKITGGISAAIYFYVRFLSGIPTWDIFLRGMFHSPRAVAAAVASVTDGMDPAMKYDAFFTFASGLLWITLTFGDMEAEGLLRFGTIRVTSVMLLVVYFFGPGAATALCWGWREEILAALAARRIGSDLAAQDEAFSLAQGASTMVFGKPIANANPDR
ncbi:predicted protein [Paecilomyces variotii No. 5]|uniref:Uncharacterized protein n=1 Tax=Byssochlamys spectabilis (strain No. 5 / NBRC 109023) TaxID=1356009 RepID=V5G4L6_BYSSN|nr:predicted protein [Paecilomyces variotii No. 5]